MFRWLRSRALHGVTASGGGEQSSLVGGVAAYYKCDEASGNLTDAFGGSPLVQTGDVGTDTGRVGGCRTFNGTTQSSTRASSTDLNVRGKAFSWSFWINPS